MMTKEDYMKLPKERLAELLVEKEWEQKRNDPTIPFAGCLDPNGICINPFHDCINCPRQFSFGGGFTTTNSLS